MGSRTGYTDGRETQVETPPKSVLREYAETILVCVIFLVFTRTFAFQQSKIPSGSMMDTLLIGDYIMVNRFVYSPTMSELERRLLPVRNIERGDVIVFKHPPEPEIDYIKRVIGLPGDVVEVRDGWTYVNDERIEEPYVKDEYRLGVFSHPPVTVPPNEYFVMGDHRNASSDSRRWKTVPRQLIKGRALMIWWSYDEGRPPDGGVDQLKQIGKKLVTFPWRSRWRRCFTLIR